MKTIICTTGTSISMGVPPDVRSRAGAPLRDAIRQRLANLARGLDARTFLERASAESNSVSRLEPKGADLVVLLHSETEDGAACAEEIERLLREHLDVSVERRRVEGLQSTDATRFRRIGVQNLFSEIARHCDSLVGGEENSVVLNVTGGFKSAVPYVTLYGLIHQIPVVYIFEQSSHIFTLPQAPVHFDYDRLAPAADAITELYRETAMPRDLFFRKIPGLAHHDRGLYEPLLDEDNGQVTLSAFGLLFHEALQKNRGNVFLSSAAARTFADSEGLAREQLAFMLDRVGNPLVRRAKKHTFHGTDLEVYKPGNTAQRMAYFMKGNDVHVCELYDAHDVSYEKKLALKRVADYRQQPFTPWVRPAELPPGPETEEELLADQARRMASLEDRCRQAEQRAEADGLRCLAIEDEAAGSRARVHELEAANAAMVAEIAAAHNREQSLREQASMVEELLADQARRRASLEDRCRQAEQRAEADGLRRLAIDDEAAGSRAKVHELEATNAAMVAEIAAAHTREQSLREQASKAVARADRFQRLLAGGSLLERLRFVLTGRLP